MNALIARAGVRWRILLVEDSPDDAELTCIMLADAGLDVECRRVDTEAEVLQALAAFAPHLVLSDFNLPGFDGARVLELVRAHAPTARFVFLTGSLGYYQLPEADGSVPKDELRLLPALVQDLLGE
ncbi:response regulator [Lysobacter koreensis]|uniref:Response regulator n=1 Tax=Lysobacter koreensis TaxID=266122 RepID=A0ABW2YPT0_9GAMM